MLAIVWKSAHLGSRRLWESSAGKLGCGQETSVILTLGIWEPAGAQGSREHPGKAAGGRPQSRTGSGPRFRLWGTGEGAATCARGGERGRRRRPTDGRLGSCQQTGSSASFHLFILLPIRAFGSLLLFLLFSPPLLLSSPSLPFPLPLSFLFFLRCINEHSISQTHGEC